MTSGDTKGRRVTSPTREERVRRIEELRYNMDHGNISSGVYSAPKSLSGFDAISWEIRKLRVAAVLLEQVFEDLGQYQLGEVHEITFLAIKEHLDYD